MFSTLSTFDGVVDTCDMARGYPDFSILHHINRLSAVSPSGSNDRVARHVSLTTEMTIEALFHGNDDTPGMVIRILRFYTTLIDH